MIPILLHLLLVTTVTAFSTSPNTVRHATPFRTFDTFVKNREQQQPSSISKSSSVLYYGTGIAETYSWEEDDYEMEITVKAPIGTESKDVVFWATSTSVHLSIVIPDNENGDTNTGDKGKVSLLKAITNPPKTKTLLDGKRFMKGSIDIDGTYWTLSEEENDQHREIVINIEKINKENNNDEYTVVERDWGGVYDYDKDEIISKNYPEPERMDVKEYAKSLGVDIDNIDMTKVDKNMFGGGKDGMSGMGGGDLNLTQSALDGLKRKGFIQEVTTQADGTEFVTEEGGAIPFDSKPLGKGINKEEFLDASIEERSQQAEMETDTKKGTAKEGTSNTVGAAAVDPIDALTVVKLKDILRKANLKVSGNKLELQYRLRGHVANLVRDKKQNRKG